MGRVFLYVLDSFGIGAMPDAADFKDEGTNTIGSCSTSAYFQLPNLKKMGLFDIDGVQVKNVEMPGISRYRRRSHRDGVFYITKNWLIS